MSKPRKKSGTRTPRHADKALDVDTALKEQDAEIQRAHLAYKASPTSFRDLRSAILDHLTRMEVHERERAEQEPDPYVRADLIAMADTPDASGWCMPARGDTRTGILGEIERRFSGTPSSTCEKALEQLIEDGTVRRDDEASARVGDAVYRIHVEAARDRVDAHATDDTPADAVSSGRANEPKRRKARLLYEQGLARIEGFDSMTWAEQRDALEHCPTLDSEDLDGLPDTSETFRRYCNQAGIRKNAPRAKKLGRSVVHNADI